MNRIIILDANLLGLVTNPRADAEAQACTEWIRACLASQDVFAVSEVSDYEVRRELIRAGKTRGLATLDRFLSGTESLPIPPGLLKLAAEVWARARQRGITSAKDRELDADLILVAQVLELATQEPDKTIIVATTNVRHFKPFVDARLWRDIPV